MKIDIAKKWCKALRSGQYKQGGKILFDGELHDALGVLVQLYLDEKKLAWNKTLERTRIDFDIEKGHIYAEAYVFRGETSCLPLCVLKWAGMSEGDGSFMEEYAAGKWTRANRQAVSELNDAGNTFSQIAAIIQADYELL